MAPDTEQLNRWLKDYKRLIYKTVIAYARTPQEQEDLFQEIAVALWRSIDRYEGRSSESTWIYKVALNTAISNSRKALIPFEEDSEADETASSVTLEDEQEIDWFYRRLRSLNPIDRSLILLYLEGMSYSEMAEILGISESAVGVKINRVKQKLKALIGADQED